MPKAMFPFLVDGKWSDTPRPKEQPAAPEPKRRREWTPRGFFKDGKPMSRREVALKASNARLWLEIVLRAGPLPSREVYRRAALEGISACGVRRAKRHHGIKSIKTGGRQYG